MSTLRELRIAKGYTQHQLAVKAKVGSQTIHRIEKGNHPALPIVIEAIARALSVSPEEISNVTVSNRLK